MEFKPLAEPIWERVKEAWAGQEYYELISKTVESLADQMECELAKGEDPVNAITSARQSNEFVPKLSGAGGAIVDAILTNYWKYAREYKTWIESRNRDFRSINFVRKPEIPPGSRQLSREEYTEDIKASTLNEYVFVDDYLLIDPFMDHIETAFRSKSVDLSQVSERNAVKAEQSDSCQEIETILDGRLETTNIAKIGDWIFTNPGGERYVVDKVKFDNTFLPYPGAEGFYTSTQSKLIIPNPTCYPIAIPSPWQSKTLMYGDADCYIVAIAEHQNGRQVPTSDRYIIGSAELSITYQICALQLSNIGTNKIVSIFAV